MIPGVKFGEKHCFDDFGMLLASKQVGQPEPRTNMIDVPGRDGLLDLSEALDGEVHFTNRELNLTFLATENLTGKNWADFISGVANYLHGQRLKIIFDDDPDYYYLGRCSINSFQTSRAKQTVEILCSCDPYKYKLHETTVIKALSTEDTEIILINDRKPVIPSITVSSETILTWGSDSYTASAGIYQFPGIHLVQGSNTLKARTTSGTGDITIAYQEGCL